MGQLMRGSRLSLLILHLVVSTVCRGTDKTEWVKNTASYDPGSSTSYLDWPRLHFAGKFLMDADTGNPSQPQAKMADLDPAYMSVATIFGLQIHISGAFSSRCMDMPMKDVNFGKIPERRHDAAMGVGMSSLLVDTKWENNQVGGVSTIMREFRETTFRSPLPNVLSIKINLDYYRMNRIDSDSYLNGRIVGSIGVASLAEPQHSFHRYHRELKSDMKNFSKAFFRISEEHGKVLLDLGTSLPHNLQGYPDPGMNKLLQVAYLVDSPKSSVFGCDTNVEEVGWIDYNEHEWYRRTAGIVSVPGTGILTKKQLKYLASRPLLIKQFDEHSRECIGVVLAERLDGVAVDVMGDFIFRQDPGDRWQVTAFLTKFGRPLRDVEMKITDSAHVTKNKMSTNCGTDLSIPFNTPVNALEYTEFEITNEYGIAVFDFLAHDPGNPRQVIDGQIYLYDIEVQLKEPLIMDNPIAILLFNDFHVSKGGPTWHGDVYPIFKLYANLFPSMRKMINLASYDDCMRKREMIAVTMSLPISDPAYMPVTRDLSRRKRDAILEWLRNPKLGRSSLSSVEDLKRDLQIALEIELATIPPYLSAWFSIKKGHNDEISSILRSILIEEMLHMTLVANILSSICGSPTLNHGSVVPKYPSKLPNDIHPGLTVSLQRFSKSLVEDVFLMIEEPDDTLPIKLRQKMLHFDEEGETADQLLHHYNTIGRFYYEKIWRSLQYNANINASLFECGNPKRQITGSDWYSHTVNRPFAVTSLDGARRAIRIITEQGEGSSPTQPFDSEGELSHYFKFLEIVMGHKLVIDTKSVQRKRREVNSIDTCKIKYSERYTQRLCGGKNKPCNTMQVREQCNVPYYFTGERLPLYEDGVWPTIDNPSSENYPNGSKVKGLSDRFNVEFSNLLRCIHNAFNGSPKMIKECMSMMAWLETLGREMAQTPIAPDGDPSVGPNGAPTFEFIELQTDSNPNSNSNNPQRSKRSLLVDVCDSDSEYRNGCRRSEL
ncbi:uncharacterized protein LOC144446184 [Glandiceps talaboti]